jgi:hypothetical protein
VPKEEARGVDGAAGPAAPPSLTKKTSGGLRWATLSKAAGSKPLRLLGAARWILRTSSSLIAHMRM